MEALSLVVFGGLLTAGILLQRRASVRLRRTNAVLSAAAHEAVTRRHGHVTIEHVMLALSFDEEIEALLAARGIDAERLRDGLNEELGRVSQTADPTRPPGLDSRVELVVRLASMRRSHPTPRSLLDNIADGPESCARALLSRVDAPLSNPEPVSDASGPYRSPPRPATTALRYWNDSRTSVPFVMGSLCEYLGHEPSRALYLTYRVHFERSFVVAMRERSEAEEIAAKITKAARANGFPLRVTTEEVT